MDMDRKKQWVADALGMTLAEVEDMGGIEWAPLECEAKGYVDPRKEDGEGGIWHDPMETLGFRPHGTSGIRLVDRETMQRMVQELRDRIRGMA